MILFVRLSKLRHGGRCRVGYIQPVGTWQLLYDRRTSEKVIERKRKKLGIDSFHGNPTVYPVGWYCVVALRPEDERESDREQEGGNRWVSTNGFNLSKYKMPGYKWVRYSGARYVVPGMVTAGRDLDGAALVVGRAHHQGDLLPAKAKPEHGIAYIAYAGEEIMKHDFEILMPVEFQWVPSRNGHIPPGAVDGGRTSDGEPLFVGRAVHNGVTCVGKVHPSHGSLYIPYNGEEIAFSEYEVLVQH